MVSKTIVAGLLVLSLSACTLLESVDQKIETCENKAYALASGFVSAGEAVHQYTKQPLCGSAQALPGKLCSSMSAIQTIKSAKNTAYIAVKSAQKVCTESTLGAAVSAFDAYKKIAEIYGGQK